MTVPQDKIEGIGVLVQEICGQDQRLETLTLQFRKRIDQFEAQHDSESGLGTGAYWRLVAFVDSLVRLRLFIENNFNYIETMGILSVARYLFELTVWLKLLVMDSRYGLV
jgi:hypothetical protein